MLIFHPFHNIVCIGLSKIKVHKISPSLYGKCSHLEVPRCCINYSLHLRKHNVLYEAHSLAQVEVQELAWGTFSACKCSTIRSREHHGCRLHHAFVCAVSFWIAQSLYREHLPFVSFWIAQSLHREHIPFGTGMHRCPTTRSIRMLFSQVH